MRSQNVIDVERESCIAFSSLNTSGGDKNDFFSLFISDNATLHAKQEGKGNECKYISDIQPHMQSFVIHSGWKMDYRKSIILNLLIDLCAFICKRIIFINNVDAKRKQHSDTYSRWKLLNVRHDHRNLIGSDVI